MGGVVHFEVPADDEERARNLYSTVFGWDFQDPEGNVMGLWQNAGTLPQG